MSHAQQQVPEQGRHQAPDQVRKQAPQTASPSVQGSADQQWALQRQGPVGNAAVQRGIQEAPTQEEAPAEEGMGLDGWGQAMLASVAPPQPPAGAPPPNLPAAPPPAVPDTPGTHLQEIASSSTVALSDRYGEVLRQAPATLEEQHSSAEDWLFTLPAPTGLEPGTPPPAQSTSSIGVPSITLPSGEGAASESSGVVADAPAADISTTPIQGSDNGNSSAPDASGAAGGGEDALASSGQEALVGVAVDTREALAPPAAPTLALVGDADPGRMAGAAEEGSTALEAIQAEGIQLIGQDFGESTVGPDADGEILAAASAFQSPALAAPVPGALLPLPPQMVSELDVAAMPFLAPEMAGPLAEYEGAQAQFLSDGDAAQQEALSEIEGDVLATTGEQEQLRQQAMEETGDIRAEWQDELNAVQADARQEMAQAQQEQLSQISQEREKANQEAQQHLDDAFRQAETKRVEADAEIAAEQQAAQEESGGFFGWARSAIEALVDGLRTIVNAIYDTLRAVVKMIFDAAIAIACGAIELYRMIVVGLIEAWGFILKGILSVVALAFPEIAAWMTARIEALVTWAIETINFLAEGLKTVVADILGFLATTIDQLLGLVQDAFNGALTIAGLLLTGQWQELWNGLSNLYFSALTAPGQFETAAYEELLGGNLDEPLSADELMQAQMMGVPIPGMDTTASASGEFAAGGLEAMPGPPWTTDNVGVDPAMVTVEPSQALLDDIEAQLAGGDSITFGASSDPSRSLESILGLGEQAVGQTAAPSVAAEGDGLSPRERAQVKWGLMRESLSAWWSDNWGYVVGGGLAAVVAVVAAGILSGGSVFAALPALMSVLGPLFVGMTIVQFGTHLRDYLAKGWAGDLRGGGKSLAKGMAAGAIELLSYATLKAGSAALKGAQAVTKGARQIARRSMAMVRRSQQFALRQGRVILNGVRNSAIGRTARNLSEFGQGLLAQTRFKSFSIEVTPQFYILYGKINPRIPFAKLPRKTQRTRLANATTKAVADIRSSRPSSTLSEAEIGAIVADFKRADASPNYSLSKAAQDSQITDDEFAFLVQVRQQMAPKCYKQGLTNHVVIDRYRQGYTIKNGALVPDPLSTNALAPYTPDVQDFIQKYRAHNPQTGHTNDELKGFFDDGLYIDETTGRLRDPGAGDYTPDYRAVKEEINDHGTAVTPGRTIDDNPTLKARQDLIDERNLLEEQLKDPSLSESQRQDLDDRRRQLLARINKKSEELGEAAADQYAAQNGYNHLYTGSGRDTLDKVYIDPNTDKIIIVECKGGASPLGSRLEKSNPSGNRERYEQGTRGYLESLLHDMRGKAVSDPQMMKVVRTIEDALDEGDVEYLLVRQPIKNTKGADGVVAPNLIDIRVYRFDLHESIKVNRD